MTEKRFEYNVNKNSIEYCEKHFAYCNGQQGKIANKLNELNDENEQLKLQYLELEITLMNNQLAYNDLNDENKELKEEIRMLNELLGKRELAEHRRKEYDEFWAKKKRIMEL